MISYILIILGLLVFEAINSIDNAIVNADVLSTVSPRAKRWFVTWGLFFGVFVMRGLLPLVILWLAINGIHPTSLQDTFFAVSGGDGTKAALAESAPVLLSGSGVFLIFLFFHWLFLEPKKFGLHAERFFLRQGLWFYAVVSGILSAIVWFALKINPALAFGATVGSTIFFITHGFKQQAEQSEEKLISGRKMSDLSKLLYLEIIDATFSIDGVLGAFAFTFSIPLILIGNGVGAIIVRYFTVYNAEKIKRYVYLKNGAMYSVFFLGSIMTLDSFGIPIPDFVAPLATFVSVGWFFIKSKRENI